MKELRVHNNQAYIILRKFPIIKFEDGNVGKSIGPRGQESRPRFKGVTGAKSLIYNIF